MVRYDNRLKTCRWHVRDEGVMAIQTGLSVTVCGHLVRLDRDEDVKVARVVVDVLTGHVVTGLETDAVKVAADLLRQRAQRFLGAQWTVVAWQPKRRAAGLGA